MNCSIADKIAKKSLDLYNSLPKKGKPVKDKEWTLLSSIVMSLDDELTVVAMATGTKCLGQSEMSARGDVVNDSHAEVLCRRCFLRFLYDQICNFKNNGSSKIIVGIDERNKYVIDPKVKFHFFTSHVPCGDASIIPKPLNSIKRKNESDEEEMAKRKKVESEIEYGNNIKEDCSRAGDTSIEDVDWAGQDIHRTGAKVVAGADPRQARQGYHTVGAVRTKPGRGDPTLSVSCSNKLARWVACGLQGALLSLLLSRPLLLDSIVVGGGGPYCPRVLERAVITRTATTHRPALLRSSLVFPESRYCLGSQAKPCPSAVLWVNVQHKPLEVCVEGRRQGATKKCRDSGRLMVCRLKLLGAFTAITGDKYQGMKYCDIKAKAQDYMRTWHQAREHLGVWTSKPGHLQHFLLERF